VVRLQFKCIEGPHTLPTKTLVSSTSTDLMRDKGTISSPLLDVPRKHLMSRTRRPRFVGGHLRNTGLPCGVERQIAKVLPAYCPPCSFACRVIGRLPLRDELLCRSLPVTSSALPHPASRSYTKLAPVRLCMSCDSIQASCQAICLSDACDKIRRRCKLGHGQLTSPCSRPTLRTQGLLSVSCSTPPCIVDFDGSQGCRRKF